MSHTPSRPLLALSCLLALTAGCDVPRLVASATGDVYQRASPALAGHFDYDLVGDALPGTIMQLEGLIEVAPGDANLTLQASRGYASYGFGWVEDEAEAARARGDAAQADEATRRAIRLYRRGRDLGFRHLDLRTGGTFRAALGGDLEGFRAYLARGLTSPADAEALFFTGYAWGLYVNARYPTEARHERAWALALVARSVELDPGFYGASGLGVLAYAATQRPGADLEAARAAWDRALAASDRENLLLLWTMSRTYAVRTDDEALRRALLREVLDADPDGSPRALRVLNLVARRRAARDLDQLTRRSR